MIQSQLQSLCGNSVKKLCKWLTILSPPDEGCILALTAIPFTQGAFPMAHPQLQQYLLTQACDVEGLSVTMQVAQD